MFHRSFQSILYSVSKEAAAFEQIALELFNYHYSHNAVYQAYCMALGVNEEKINQLDQIPYLPISLFKGNVVGCHPASKAVKVFESSGTSGQQTSKHFAFNLGDYKTSLLAGFEKRFGPPKDWTIIALLPGYVERKNASLIYMVNALMEESKAPNNGYYLNQNHALIDVLSHLQNASVKTLLFGVSHALLDLIEAHQLSFPTLHVMETGGMKGRRKELIREELHQLLQKGFGTKHILSEYGMTELFSQAYFTENKGFKTPDWMRVSFRQISDPLTPCQKGKSGAINVIDLANLESCPFIATDDIGRQLDGEYFEVLGRMDNSDMRGCNLMIS